jgi:hypothetical protein
MGPTSVTITATQTGGNGGASTGTGHGGSGAASIIDRSGLAPLILGISSSGTMSIVGIVEGGNGGSVNNAASAATGGIGGDATAMHAVGGTTAGTLTLTQTARAGNGGRSFSGSGAPGGNAISVLNLPGGNHPSLAATVNANGGLGGATSTSTSGIGGNALAEVTLANSQRGTATANATGGAAGAPTGPASGGIGGSGTANASATAAGGDAAQATANAIGGNGGLGTGMGTVSGNGGAATANANASSLTGTASAVASAQAGNPGSITLGAVSGQFGAANSSTFAVAPIRAQGQATANGGMGNATSTALSPATGRFSFVKSIATAQVGSVARADAQTLVNLAIPTYSTAITFQAAAYIGANPSPSEITTRWTSAPAVQAAFLSNASNAHALGITALQYPASSSPGVHTYSTVLQLNENHPMVTGNGLLVGLLNTQQIGDGLGMGDRLRLRAVRNGDTLIDLTFTTNAAFHAFFTNTVLNLGVANSGLNGENLDVSLLFDLTSSHPSAGVATQFMVGTPAPTAAITWLNPAGGSWASRDNWPGNVLPSGPGLQIHFNHLGNAGIPITLDQDTTAGTVNFNTNFPYTFTPGAVPATLRLDNGNAPAAINVAAGNHVIATPLAFKAAGAAITLNGNLLTLQGKITGQGPLTVNGPGTVRLTPSTGTGKVSKIVLSGSPDAWSAQLDVTNNPVIVQTAGTDKAVQQATLLNQLAFGRINPFSGNGITSSTVPATASTALALADNADLHYTSFRGQFLDENAFIMAQARFGDANLDEKVDAFDLNLLAAHWQQASGALWSAGDFNLDHAVDAFDLNLLAANWQFGTGGGAFSIADFERALAQAGAVPEPATLAVLGLAMPMLLRRRRIRQRG